LCLSVSGLTDLAFVLVNPCLIQAVANSFGVSQCINPNRTATAMPPECAAYWGEVGFHSSEDHKKRIKNQAVKPLAKNMARNLVYYAAQLLK